MMIFRQLQAYIRDYFLVIRKDRRRYDGANVYV